MGTAVVDEALHVSQRVAEKQTNLVGKGVLGAKPLTQPLQCGLRAQVRYSRTRPGIPERRVCADRRPDAAAGTYRSAHSRFWPAAAAGKRPWAPAPGASLNLSGQLFLTAVTAGKQVGGFQVGQCGGTMVDEITVQRHGGRLLSGV